MKKRKILWAGVALFLLTAVILNVAHLGKPPSRPPTDVNSSMTSSVLPGREGSEAASSAEASSAAEKTERQEESLPAEELSKEDLPKEDPSAVEEPPEEVPAEEESPPEQEPVQEENAQNFSEPPGSVPEEIVPEEPGSVPEESICLHEWVDVVETIHHEEEGHEETVVLQEAYDEILDIVEEVRISKCRCRCGQIFDNDAQWEAHSIELADDEEDIHDSFTVTYIYEETVIGQETIHHEAVTETVWVVDRPAYDEEIVTGRRCLMCGATE